MKENIFEELREYCADNFVTRKELCKITGGFLPPGTLAQLDTKGIGIPSHKLGQKIVYQLDDVIEWLKSNTTLINFDD